MAYLHNKWNKEEMRQLEEEGQKIYGTHARKKLSVVNN